MKRVTFTEFADQVLAERAEYIRGVPKERSRYELHVRTAPFADMPIGDIRSSHVIAWLRIMQTKRAKDRRGERTLSKATIERCSALTSVIFSEAVVRDLAESNPCNNARLKKRADESATKEPWAYLTLDEQRAVKGCQAIPEADRVAMQFAWGTGLRQGEQFNLEIRDVHVDGPEPFVFVRFGSPGLPPKSGKCRRVPLFGDGLEAAKRQLALVRDAYNPHGLLFPSRSGSRRGVGKPLGRGAKLGGRWTDPFHQHLKAAGIKKHVRWHDLRHTCFTSLVVGCWGRAWRLEEIQVMAGHSSITITQRYAHLGDDSLKVAARETFAARDPAPVKRGVLAWLRTKIGALRAA